AVGHSKRLFDARATSVQSTLQRQFKSTVRRQFPSTLQRQFPSTLQRQFKARCGVSSQALCSVSSKAPAASVPSTVQRQLPSTLYNASSLQTHRAVQCHTLNDIERGDDELDDTGGTKSDGQGCRPRAQASRRVGACK